MTSYLALGLAFGFSGILPVIFTLALPFGLAFSLAFGFTFGLTFGLSEDLAGSLIKALFLGLAVGCLGFLVGYLAGCLGLMIFFYINYFRLWLYPWYFMKSLIYDVSLTNNPYIDDGVIWLPIWGLTSKLTKIAQQDPETGLAFVKFLQEYRPLQKQLAMHIAHAATASKE